MLCKEEPYFSVKSSLSADDCTCVALSCVEHSKLHSQFWMPSVGDCVGHCESVTSFTRSESLIVSPWLPSTISTGRYCKRGVCFHLSVRLQNPNNSLSPGEGSHLLAE